MILQIGREPVKILMSEIDNLCEENNRAIEEWAKIYRYQAEQTISTIGEVQLGGQPGELPTVLIGTIFYKGHKVITDPQNGIFDKPRTEALIIRQEELSDMTGTPHMFDIVGESARALIKELDFVASVTNVPLLIDGLNESIRIHAVRHAMETGLGDRVIYNSLGVSTKDSEMTELRESGIKAAIVLAYSLRHLRPQQKLELLLGKNGDGLLHTAKQVGLEQLLIDPAVFDVPGVAFTAEAIHCIKQTTGLPAGCASANAIDEWTRVKELGSDAKKVCYPGISIITQLMGADFILYGPVERADVMFPACAMADAVIAYHSMHIHKIHPKNKNHPLYRIF
jgi:tetrahydromethanopterin S-methyltransferase subunit H